MKTHELKIIPKYFDDVKNHIKNFEVRFNDRQYQIGDTLVLREWHKGKFTGREYTTSIIYILDDTEFLNQNYVVLGLAVPKVTVNQTDNNNTFVSNAKNLTFNL